MKTVNFLLALNLIIIVISGLGVSYSILSMPESNTIAQLPSDPKVLGFNTTEKCNDSDASNINSSIYIKGVVKYMEDKNDVTYHRDYCIDDNQYLVEEFCEYSNTEKKVGIKSIIYKCENGCSDGACIKI